MLEKFFRLKAKNAISNDPTEYYVRNDIIIVDKDLNKLKKSSIPNKGTHFTLKLSSFNDSKVSHFKKLMTVPKKTVLRAFEVYLNNENTDLIFYLNGILCENFILNFENVSSISSEKIQVLKKIMNKSNSLNVSVMLKYNEVREFDFLQFKSPFFMAHKIAKFKINLETFTASRIENRRLNVKIIKTVYISTNAIISVQSSGFDLVMIDEIKSSKRFKEINFSFLKNSIPFLKKTKMIFSQKTKIELIPDVANSNIFLQFFLNLFVKILKY